MPGAFALHHISSSDTQAAKEYWGMETPLSLEEISQKVQFNADGLVPAIAQQHDTGEVLMMAWMNTESLMQTLQTGRAVYFSRSRQSLWRKGDSSGHIQQVKSVFIDCDGDTLLLKIDQTGAACHTGKRSCFYTPVSMMADHV